MTNRSIGAPALLGLALCCLLAAPPARAQAWIDICAEGQICNIDGTRLIRFGVNGAYVYGAATGRLFCSVEAYGDPAPGAPKACAYQMTRTEQDLNGAIAQRDQQIQALNAAIAPRDQQIQALSAAVGQRDQQIQALQAQAADLQAQLDEANAELDRYERIIRRVRRSGDSEYGPIYRQPLR